MFTSLSGNNRLQVCVCVYTSCSAEWSYTAPAEIVCLTSEREESSLSNISSRHFYMHIDGLSQSCTSNFQLYTRFIRVCLYTHKGKKKKDNNVDVPES